MFAHERHQAISELVGRRQRLTVEDIREALSISPATLRRDLSILEKAGRLVRVHGGVMHPQAFRGEPSFVRKSAEAVPAKQAIAAAASAMVPAHATVFVDAGTTCLEIGRRLMERRDIKLFTNSVPFVYEAYLAGSSVIAIGGELRPISGALTDALALEWVKRLRVDWAFIGASSARANGLATTELSEAAVKQQILKNAGRRVLAADGSKWNHPAPILFAEWRDFQHWLTSEELPAGTARTVAKSGVKVTRCKA